MNDYSAIVTCPSCQQHNRLPAILAPDKVVICGRCKTPLRSRCPAGDEEDEDDLDDDDDDLDDDDDEED